MSSLSPFWALLWAKRRMARHWVASVRRESKLKVAFVSVSAVSIWVGGFLFSRLGFRAFESFGREVLAGGSMRLSDLIMARLLAVFALAVFFMLIVSNVLVAYATLYRSREVAFLVQSPMSVPSFFLGRFYECINFSSWAVAFLGSPILLAYGLERHAPLLYYPALAALYLPFVVIPAALGAILTMLLVRLVAGLPRGRLVVVALLVPVLLFAYFRDRLRSPDLRDPESVQAIIDTMGQTQSPFLPSYWVTQGMLGAAKGEVAEVLFYVLLLSANALLLTWLAVLAAEALFYRGWTDLLGSDEGRSPRRRRGPLGGLDRLLGVLPQPGRAMIVKDLKLFWRDPTQWSQFLLFFGIMALYLANVKSTGGVFSSEVYRRWISLLNMTACMLILATLTTRFVFPLVSLEGRRFWILGLAPVGLRRVVWQKFWLSVGSTSVFTVSLALISGLQLDLTPDLFLLSLLSIVATTIALSGLAVGLGSLYPNFEEDNPARITSSMGGTLNFMLSLLYVLLVTVAQGFVVHGSVVREAIGERPYRALVATAAVVILLLTLTTWLLPMRLGLRNLERTEV